MLRYFTVLAAVLCYQVLYAQEVEFLKLEEGLVDPTPEQKRLLPTASLTSANFTVKSAIDLGIYLPSASTQGKQGSCTAFAVAYGMKTIQENIKKKKIFNPCVSTNRSSAFSPAYLFNTAKKINGSPNCTSGITFIEALVILKDSGAVFQDKVKYYPNDINACFERITPSDHSNAKKYRISSFEAPELNRESFQLLLSNDNPIGISVYVDANFEIQGFNKQWSNSNPFIWKSFQSQQGSRKRHAMLCVGYSDQLKAFKVLNSWGEKFGTCGFFWIDYNFMFDAVYDAYVSFERRSDYKDIENLTSSPNSVSSFVESDTLEFSDWVKKGFYHDIGRIRLGCFYVDKESGRSIFQFSDISNQQDIKVINKIDIGNHETKSFTYDGYQHRVRLNRIDKAGNNPFNPASYFTYVKVKLPEPVAVSLCDEIIVSITPQLITLVPSNHTHGDLDFFGNGPSVEFRANLQIKNGNRITCGVSMRATETNQDTQFTGEQEQDLYQLSAEYIDYDIVSIVSDSETTFSYTDSNTDGDNFVMGAAELVRKLSFIGDTYGGIFGGSDLGRTKVDVDFNVIQIKIKRRRNCSETNR
ncbi:MAG: C1 family peptidase [Cyclobacteriaceae bacterium]